MKRTTAQAVGYFGVYFLIGVIVASLGPTLPALAENVGVGFAAISSLFIARSFGYLVGSLFGGRLYDRLNGHYLLASLLLISMLTLAFVPVVGTMLILASTFFLIGAAQGGMDVGVNTLLVRASTSNIGVYLNAMFFFAGIGSFLIPIYLGRVSLAWGYRGIALALIPIFLWVFFTPAPEIPQRAAEGENAKLSDPVLYIAFILLAFIFIGSEVSYGGWLFTYFASSGLGSESTAYTLNSIFWMSIMLGRLLAIPVAARFKLERIIVAYLAGAVISAGILYFLRAHAIAVWVGSIGMGLSMAALFPSTYTLVQQRMKLSGKLTGMVWAMGSLGAMTLPWVIGQRIERVGPASMMQTMLLVWILALGIFLAALRPRPSAGSR
ncbi:MAG: MFS transporter [Anaerolineae bacterium]|nr:MFS transporter [Anaerolineae bacterium]MBT7070032.1 MFS transporter [Anaerolineae bacterium]MBT7325309.1 MFS transporter [Anaerolineae bacterium]